MKIITLLNEKGGVGKTTLATTLAAGLAIKGYRTLLLDTDEQGNSSVALGGVSEPGFFELLVRNAQWATWLRQLPQERYQEPGALIEPRLFLLPGNVDTRAIPYTVDPDSKRLKKRLAQMESVFDVVVIDTAPAASLLHLLIYMATDYVIYPTRLEYLSMAGLAKSIDHLAQANGEREERRAPLIRVMGIVPTMVRANTIEHQAQMDFLREAHDDLVWPSMRQGTLWAEASGRQCSIFNYVPHSAEATEAWRFVNKVEEVLKSEQEATQHAV